MYPRYSELQVKEALSDTPVVFIMGPRQAGKTTLVKTAITQQHLVIIFMPYRWEHFGHDVAAF